MNSVRERHAEGSWLGLEMGENRVSDRATCERGMSREAFEGEAAECIDVTRRCRGCSADHLGCEIVDRPRDTARLCEDSVCGAPREPEVGQGSATRLQQHVRWLHISMKKLTLVQRVEGRRDLGHDANRVAIGQRPFRSEARRERATFDETGDEKGPAVLLTSIEDLDDMWVHQGCSDPALSFEAAPVHLISRELGCCELQCDEHAVVADGPINRAGRSSAELHLEEIATEPPPDLRLIHRDHDRTDAATVLEAVRMTPKTLVGTAFAGYRVERLLGRGGMSVVYLAEHPRLKNKVALKLLAPALAEDDIFRERLLHESRLAASLNHPNVIPVYDTGEEDGVLFVSMRFVAGSDLRALIRSGGTLSISETTSVITQSAAALDAAHAGGLVHRDIKPANILLEQGGEPPGHVYVADFGLTTHTDARSGATASGVVGTVDYMAPEQIEGRQIDGRADVYALGCVFFECLVGRPPFKLDTDVAVLWAHIREDPPLPGDVDRSLPRAFDGIVDRALAKNPRDRYATCGELAADVRAAAGTHRRPARAARVRLPRPRVRARRRWLAPAVLALVLGTAIGAGSAIAIRGDGHPTAQLSQASDPSPSLLALVPPTIRSSCLSAPPPSPDFDASVVCRPADPTVTSVRYSHARSASRMRAQLVANAYAAQAAKPGEIVRPVGECSKGSAPAVHAWNVTSNATRTQSAPAAPGRERGRLLCYTSLDGWSAVEWTDKNYDVYSTAYGPTRYGLYRWWRVRGGPTPPS